MTELYWFSATGNSLSTAKKLQKLLDGAVKLLPCAALAGKTVRTAADAVGFVFPIFYGDMPWPVREMIGRMEFEGKPYIFAAATYGGGQGATAARLSRLLETRGQVLSLFEAIQLPGNSRIHPPEADEKALKAQDENCAAAARRINGRVSEDYSALEDPGVSTVGKGAENFRGMKADESCVGCGICAEVCPMGNIEIINGHAEIGNRCATCLACFHWCPQEAVYMSKAEAPMQRRSKYHHPDISVGEIASQKSIR